MEHMISLLATFQYREQLIREADAIWHERAREVAALIPESMHKFADEHGWIKSEVDGWWKLPEFLEHLVGNTQSGGGNSEKIDRPLLSLYGFQTFARLEAGLLELARAWDGLVRIEIDKSSAEDRWDIRYYAAEVTPPPQET